MMCLTFYTVCGLFFFFKQKTRYEMRISDWSSDVCSSDLLSLRESLRLQSIRDPLTGLVNRLYLDESVTRELARCERRGLPLSLLMLDIDHFKAFNDVH